jgi:hypothetical protein
MKDLSSLTEVSPSLGIQRSRCLRPFTHMNIICLPISRGSYIILYRISDPLCLCFPSCRLQSRVQIAFLYVFHVSPLFTLRTARLIALSLIALMTFTTLMAESIFSFLNFPMYLQSVTIHSDTFSKWCVGKRGRVGECSVAPLRNKGAETLCPCREERVQTKESTN